MEYVFLLIIAVGLASYAFYQQYKQRKTTEMIIYGGEHEETHEEVVDLQAETDRITKLSQMIIQAKIVGDDAAYQSALTGSYDGELPLRRDDGGWLSVYDNLRIMKIAGINHRQNVGRYAGQLDVALVPEPTNEFDPDAVKIVAEDGHHLGYIASHNTEFVRVLAGDHFPMRCTAFIEKHEDEFDGHTFYVGYVYIVKRENVDR